MDITNKRNEILKCTLYEPIGETKSSNLVIYLHGNSGSRLEAL